MTRRKDPTEIRTPVARDDLPAFETVQVKPRHDGWTPARQRAFIAALADTGSVSRAARHVNMSPEGAYYLRRRPGAESFRRAWEAAIDMGVTRLRDEAFDRALNGQLSPVFVAGKLKGFRRIKNDRLLMFCLRMNARAPDGRRYSASYFDSGADRLSGSSSSEAVGQIRNFNPASYTIPALSKAEKDDMNAAMVEHFDPVDMTLAEIEAMQADLARIAEAKRAEEDGPPDGDVGADFVAVGEERDWAAVGELVDLYGGEEDELGEFEEGEEKDV
ncbi:hypothetical protein [Qipengyuania sp. MTN3-11]|uniref:hypothetical protein n=1 Tax=Qipengyuania sp. MTN3-11 TaxID=3056557 RepID=UPI0036F3B025